MVSIAGIDISSNNHPREASIDWQQVVAGGYQFAFIKASEGVRYTNPWFSVDWDGAITNGVLPFAYHFARPTKNSAAAEADYFLSRLPVLTPGQGIALDMEDGPQGDRTNYLNWTLTWLNLVTNGLGFRPIFYDGPWHMEPHGLMNSDELAQFGLWLAQYQVSLPAAPPNWPFIAIWQSGQGSVPGIVGDVDLDQFLGTLDQLKALGKPGSVPVPPVPPDDPCAALQAQLDQIKQDEGSGRNRMASATSEVNMALGHLATAVDHIRAATEDISHG